MKNLKGKFEKVNDYWFVHVEWEKRDFYVPKKSALSLNDWDFVEIEVLDKKKWKNMEAKILKVLDKKSDIKTEEWNIVWKYSENEGGFWFIDVEWVKKWFFVFSWNKSTAMDWDIVEARVKVFKWRTEAEIIKVLERKKRIIVWKFEKWKKDFSFVIPKNDKYKNDIFVLNKNSLDAWNWDLVWIEVTKWNKKNPEWKIVEILSSNWKLDKREEKILTLSLEAGAHISFNEKIEKELKKVNIEIDKNEISKRKDLRKLFTITIDSIDAKDLDDAISIEKFDNGDYKLYVHIADVTHYVLENSELDREALERGTSIYLADRVIPMLPKKLSNDLCSLNPNTDKLTLTCEMLIWWKTGHVVKSRIYNSVINTDFRMTYKDIDEIDNNCLKLWDNTEFWQKISQELLDNLNEAQDLKKLIINFRKQNWVLDFDFKETYIKFDEKWNVLWIEEYKKYFSNKMIEAFMVCANESVAKEFNFLPFLYRIHEIPKETDLLDLYEKLNLFWVKFNLKEVTPKEFSALLDFIQNDNIWRKTLLEKFILRALTEAQYSDNNLGHFWLGLNYYSHFTSPIRRYPDLQIHRIIKEALSNWVDENSKKSKYSLKKDRLVYYKTVLPKVAKQCSENEKRAEKLEYKVRDYFIVKYYKNKIWEEFEGTISWMIPKWFFVELNDTAEWFVEMNEYSYDDKLMLFSWKNWEKYTFWDKLKVRLIEADEKLLRLNFEIVK